MTHTSIDITGITTVGVPVTDQDRALDFYVGILGFEKRLDAPLPTGQRWIVVAPPGSPGPTIALECAAENRPAGIETGIRLTTPDAEVAHAALRSGEVRVDKLLRWPDVPPMFAFRDQDDNRLEIVQDT
jgi:catechol 2,3-dioxygenase-like lactoylglutathione lyase family enzyme